MDRNWFNDLVSVVADIGYCTVGVATMTGEAIQSAAVVTGKSTLAGLEVVNTHLTTGFDVLVDYLDERPGLAAVVSFIPAPAFRRIAYRHTEEAINRSRDKR